MIKVVVVPPGPVAISVVRKTVSDVGVVNTVGVVVVAPVEVVIFEKGATVVELLTRALIAGSAWLSNDTDVKSRREEKTCTACMASIVAVEVGDEVRISFACFDHTAVNWS